MKTKKNRLGRGLDALLGDTGASVGEIPPDKLQRLPVEILQRGQFQPRQECFIGSREIDPLVADGSNEKVQQVGRPEPAQDGGGQCGAG